MDGLKDINELDDYLSQAIEKVSDPIAWWCDHWKVYPKLLAMVFDFLSIPGIFLSSLVLLFQLIMFISNLNCC